MGTLRAPPLADIFLYPYEADFIVYALNGKETAYRFNHTGTSMIYCPKTTHNSKIIWA